MEKIESENEWQEEPEDKWNEIHPRRLIPELCQLFYHLGLEVTFFLKMLTFSVIKLFFSDGSLEQEEEFPSNSGTFPVNRLYWEMFDFYFYRQRRNLHSALWRAERVDKVWWALRARYQRSRSQTAACFKEFEEEPVHAVVYVRLQRSVDQFCLVP